MEIEMAVNETDNRFDRLEERRERRAVQGSGGWAAGAFLILLGLLLFGQNLKIWDSGNWWAFFILLPAFGCFSAAWSRYKAAGRFTMSARSAVIVGLVLVLVAFIFLFGLNWTILGPGLLILAGIGLFVNALLPG
jgi:hypothetical protein